jgi:mercuric reductase
MAALITSKNAIVHDLCQDKYLDLSREYGWDIVRGAARFARGPVVEVDGRAIEAKHYLIATGSVPSVPPIEGLAQVPYLTSTTAMELQELPESLIVVGGNYIGLELGQLFARLGSRVTIVEALDRIAPHEEPEISNILADVLREEGLVLRRRFARSIAYKLYSVGAPLLGAHVSDAGRKCSGRSVHRRAYRDGGHQSSGTGEAA